MLVTDIMRLTGDVQAVVMAGGKVEQNCEIAFDKISINTSVSINTNNLYKLLPLGSLSEKNTGFFGSFSHTGGEGLPKSQNFCDLTK